MFKRIKNAVSHITSGHIFAEEIFEGEKEKTIFKKVHKNAFADDNSFLKDSDAILPYVRPHFLCLSPDEVQASNNQSARPVIVPKKIFLMPLSAGYAECTNAYKTDVNEDQSSAFILPLNSQYPVLKQLTYFGLFDGHDGASASILASQHLHLIIKDNIQLIMEEVENVLFETSPEVESEIGGGDDDGEAGGDIIGESGGGNNNNSTKKRKKLSKSKNNELENNEEGSDDNDVDDDKDVDDDNDVEFNDKETEEEGRLNDDDNKDESHIILHETDDGNKSTISLFDYDDSKSHITLNDDDDDIGSRVMTNEGVDEGIWNGMDVKVAGSNAVTCTDSCTQTNFDVFVDYSRICKHCGKNQFPWQKKTPQCYQQQHHHQQQLQQHHHQQQQQQHLHQQQLQQHHHQQQQQPWQTNQQCLVLPTFEELVVGALEVSFQQMDELIGEELGLDGRGGCAAIVVVILANKLFVANAGDCRCVMYNAQTNENIQLSTDHSPHNEQHRIRNTASVVGRAELEKDRWTTTQYLKHPYQSDSGRTAVYREAWMNGWFKKTLTDVDIKSPLIYGKGKRSRLMQTIGLSRVLGDHNLKLFSTDISIKPYLLSVPEVSIVELKRLFDEDKLATPHQLTTIKSSSSFTTTHDTVPKSSNATPSPKPSLTLTPTSSPTPTSTSSSTHAPTSSPTPTATSPSTKSSSTNFISHAKKNPPSFLILASDGLWDTVSNQDAVECVLNSLNITDSQNPKRFIIAAQDLGMMARIKNVATSTTSIPATTISIPATTTSIPATATSIPATTISIPATTTSIPATTTSIPATTTFIPATTTVRTSISNLTINENQLENTGTLTAPNSQTSIFAPKTHDLTESLVATEKKSVTNATIEEVTTATNSRNRLQWSTIDDISIFVIPLYSSVITH